MGREILREETGGSISSKTYYGLGMKVVNPIGQTKTSYTFDNGKVQQSIDNQGNELQFRYDAQGNTVKTILPTGHEVISEFNILNQQD
ncbi:MAG: RHS repeat protein [Saprospiraceae bacterium]|nr:RHS repeat protein [Saprospiraceae bacterium]